MGFNSGFKGLMYWGHTHTHTHTHTPRKMSTKITLHLNTEGQIVLNLQKYLAKLHVITCSVSLAQNIVNIENY